MLGGELKTTRISTPPTIDFPQLGLQVQTPDLRVIGQLIAVQSQAFNDGIEYRFGHERTMKRALGLDGGGLFTGHSGGEQQGPHTGVSRKRANTAFDTGNQAQALAGEAEVARHGGDPR
jgi:hypothetical protein